MNLQPSAWVQRFAQLVRPGGSVLDVACGSGRNLRWLAAQGLRVTGIDRDDQALAVLRDALAADAAAELLAADIENAPWPLPGRRFDAVVVTNYLWRPLWPALLAALADDGGVLLVETFAEGQQHIGRPKRPEFLLQPGELLRVCAALRVVAYEDGYEAHVPRHVQRIAAVNQSAATASDTGSPRHGLTGGLTEPPG